MKNQARIVPLTAQTVPTEAEVITLKTPKKRSPGRLRPVVQQLFPAACGIALLLLIWQIASLNRADFPGPFATGQAALDIFAHPFYYNGPNDQGIGWNILASLQRVGTGFLLAALVGIPGGFLLGRSLFLSRMFNPIIALLRPVSPLAWLPVGLLLFQRAEPASCWTIFICSIWPMLINTAEGVRGVPQDYLNVARVLKLPEITIMRKILFPAVLPAIMTGVRLSISTAWLVIVAAEMLTGGMGIGYWIWNEWNNLNVEHILIAIGVIGIVGLLLEQALLLLARQFSWQSGRKEEK